MNKKLIAILGVAVFALALINTDKILKAASYGGSMVISNVNQNDEPINDADLVGRKYVTLSNSTTETLVCAVPCVIDSVVITSGATTNFLILSDSNSATGNGNVIFAPGLYMGGSGKNTLPLSGFKPIATNYGLTIDASAADGYSALVAYHLK